MEISITIIEARANGSFERLVRMCKALLRYNEEKDGLKLVLMITSRKIICEDMSGKILFQLVFAHPNYKKKFS